MEINEEFFKVLINYCKGWTQSAGRFMALVEMIDFSSNTDQFPNYWDMGMLSPSGKQLAEVMLRELNINIQPYRDLEEMCADYKTNKNILSELQSIIANFQIDDNVLLAIDEANASPSEDTMQEEVLRHYMSEQIVERLRPFVVFV